MKITIKKESLDLASLQNDYALQAITCINLWFIPLTNGTCHCGSSVHNAVICNEKTKVVEVLDCYCMTPEHTTGHMVVGNCFYNCVNMSSTKNYKDSLYIHVPSNCSYLHRTGTLCGQCNYSDNYFPPPYSYNMECIKCDESNSWWWYITVAFVPLTVFIGIILVFRISVVSPDLRAFVCISQIISAPVQVRIILLSTKYTSPLVATLTKILSTIYGIWNLDFFRTVLPNICLHLKTLQVISLDYMIAVYPMLLMVLAYILVELHGYGCRPVLFLWKPFHKIFAQFRREWNIQTSLIDAFASFFLLSIMKLFSVSFDFLIPTTLYISTGESIGYYLYYDPNIKYMKNEHLYFALLALIVLLLFIFLPLSLLVLSTFSCVQRRLQINIVHQFLHTFQKYYKDGTNGTRDCRWFSTYNIFSLIGVYMIYSFTLTGYTYQLATVYFLTVAIIVLIIEPYKEEYAIYNSVDCVVFLWHAMFTASITLINIVGYIQSEFLVLAYVIIDSVCILPLLLIMVIVVNRLIGCFKTKRESDINESLAHRITNTDEYIDNCGYVTLHSQQSIDSNTET